MGDEVIFIIEGLVQELTGGMVLVPFKYTHLEWASKQKECSNCSFNIISISTSTISCSTNIYLNIKWKYTFLIFTSCTGSWICFLRRADTSILVYSTLSQLCKLHGINTELILNDGAGIAQVV
jgi:hypothetical protein